MNRRDFLRGAGATAAAAAVGTVGGIGLSRLTHGEARVRRFRSRPDLCPPAPRVVRSGPTAPGYVLTTPMGGPGHRGLLVLDDAGEPVWSSPSPPGLARLNLLAQRYRGRDVLTWWEGRLAHGHGGGAYVLLDSTYREVARVRAGNGLRGDLHDFVLTSAGTALMTIYDRVQHGGRTVLDGVVQEVDVATGDVVLEWRSLGHVPVAESYRPPPRDPSIPWDYFHLNSVGVDLDGGLLVSGRHTCAIYKLDRRTGAVRWRLGGRRSDFALGPGARTWFQHDARRHPDGTLTVFDNGAPPAHERLSRALTLRLDERARRAEVARADTHADVLATAMGNVQALPGGGVFVGWGTEPFASEFAAGGALVYDLRMPEGAISYRAFRRPWRGEPAEPPALAVVRDGAGARAYASWNGATEVAAWQAHVDGRPAESALRTGFETELRLARPGRRVVVAALDAAGRELGRSRPVAL